jgi:xanthine/CO dehydrogenase XdhC/CoxF family maturation factor
MADEISACDVAHTPIAATGSQPVSLSPQSGSDRTLVAVFASPVAAYLLRFAADCQYRCILFEPDEGRAAGAVMSGFTVVRELPRNLDGADVVLTDHHRAELGIILQEALESKARWIGIMGNARHEGPHVEALRMLGVPDGEIARVHRPIGLNIGSRIPPEIAIATLAALLADRNGRDAGFLKEEFESSLRNG